MYTDFCTLTLLRNRRTVLEPHVPKFGSGVVNIAVFGSNPNSNSGQTVPGTEQKSFHHKL